MIRNYPQEFGDIDVAFRKRLADLESDLDRFDRAAAATRERIRDAYADYYRQISVLALHAVGEGMERKKR